jgi:hypothetical protein
MHRAFAARARGFDSLPLLSLALFTKRKKKVSKRQYSSKAKVSTSVILLQPIIQYMIKFSTRVLNLDTKFSIY